MSILSNNIKFLRKKLGFTQEQFAEKIGIKRSLVGAYEEGRADPRLNNLQNMANLFGFSVDALLAKDFSNLPEDKWHSDEIVKDSTSVKVLSITVDKQDRENIELVPQKAAAGYLNGYADPEYLEDLPKFQIPTLNGTGTYRAFEINGDSMLPLQSGTIVVGKYVEQWQDVKSGKTYVLITKDEGVVYKRVFNYGAENGKLFLVSDNQSYTPYDVKLEDIMEIWEAKVFISSSFPEPESEKEISLEKLTGIVLSLQQDVIKLKDKK
ncbi:XRE family transcriptional regulator [Peijinzhouia sedimentorum]